MDREHEARIDQLLRDLTLDEKVAMCAGSGPWHSTGCERLGIPPFKMTDGPNGARGDGVSGTTSVCMPVGSALAASFSPALIREVGRALGQEARSKGAQVLLGPTVNIHRHPLGGRNFECYSEDPLLTARIAVAFIEGVQSESVGACIKHYCCNDSEYQRYTISSEVSDRALREIYLPPFEAAVREAGVWSVMSAYNRVGGVAASSHHRLLHEILKDEWGFEGFVVSDWGASLDTVGDANGGLDLEMPGPARTMGARLLEAVKTGQVEEATIDDKVRRLLYATLRSGRLDEPDERPERSEDRPEHRALARRAAIEGMVLIKNEGILPLAAEEIRTLAVIGPNAEQGMIQGGGSSAVLPHYHTQPLATLRARLGERTRVVHEEGCRIDRFVPAIPPAWLRPADGSDGPGLALEYRNGEGFDGPAVAARVVRRCNAFFMGGFHPDVDASHFSARYSGTLTPETSGTHTFGLLSAGPSRLFLDDALIIDNWTDHRPGESFFGHGSDELRADVALEAGESYLFRVEYQRERGAANGGIQFGVRPPEPRDLIERAEEAARSADAVVLVLGTNGQWETEGNDRRDMDLPGRQCELARRVLACNPRTVVVLNAGSPLALPFYDQAPALLHTFFPGQEFGNALADVLLGDAEPGGRMPTSWPMRLEDTPAFTSYPGDAGRVYYGEGVFVGYRWYDARRIEPRVPFGHGLGYARIDFGAISAPERARAGQSVELSLTLTNTGERAGQEVAQLYLAPLRPRQQRPEQELVGFEKVALAPGARATVEFELDARAFASWDESADDWVVDPGEFEIRVGASSRDIRQRARLTLS